MGQTTETILGRQKGVQRPFHVFCVLFVLSCGLLLHLFSLFARFCSLCSPAQGEVMCSRHPRSWVEKKVFFVTKTRICPYCELERWVG